MIKNKMIKTIKKKISHIPTIYIWYQYLAGKRYNWHVGSGEYTINARYCYSVWLRHLVKAFECGMKTYPKNICEFGPGASLGTGMAALLGGADTYIAMDIVNQSDLSKNITVVKELVELYKNHTPIPDDTEFPNVQPKLTSYEFPKHIISDLQLDEALNSVRINKIISELENNFSDEKNETNIIRFLVPWDAKNLNCENIKCDFLFSQACLEHVDKLEDAYAAMAKFVNYGGWMAHDIDFRSHSTHRCYNGQYAYSDRVWSIMRGKKRPYFINRRLLSEHLELISKNHFTIVKTIPIQYNIMQQDKTDQMDKKKASKKYSIVSDEDFYCATCYILSKKEL